MAGLGEKVGQASGAIRFEQDPKTYSYPRKGSNNNVNEIDLRVWDTLFCQSLKVLMKWDQYYDITKALQLNVDIPNIEMIIEYAWNHRNWTLLKQYENVMKRSDSIKHRLYLLFLSIRDNNIQNFDEIFKTAISFASSRWDVNLPKYVDNIHFENLILYQLLMEGSEGGRNMIKEV